MPYFVYLSEEDSGQENNNIIVVRAGPDDVIFVPFKYLPIPIDSKTHADPFEEIHDVETDDKNDRRQIYALMHIDDLYEKLIESGNDSNMELAQSILEHSKYDGWGEGWAWNINTSNFEQCPEPSGQTHCWVHHTQSWESTRAECFKSTCPSVEILSHKISLSSLEEIYCDCDKCEHCDFIYDNDECKCPACRQKSSDASSDSSFVRCEHCYVKYDSSNQRQHDHHFLKKCG